MDFEALRLTTTQALQQFLSDALIPLHNLTWQTFTLLAALVILALSLAAWILRVSWRFPGAKAQILNARIKPNHHMYADHLRISLPDYLRLHKLSPDLKLTSPALDRRLKEDATRYYVVTVVETSKRKAVLYKEMRVHMPMGNRWRPNANDIQFDQATLTDIRLNNGFDEDDDPQSGTVSGAYEVFIRPVRWYDVRHWLTHPNREIRIVVWVTIITTALPTVLDLLFG
jgi:hypothetical protein